METALLVSYICSGLGAVAVVGLGFVLIMGLNRLKEEGIVEEDKEE